MKKFLSKLPVMVTFVVVAVLLLALNIGMLARPVSYGMAYKGKTTQEGMTLDGKFTFKNNKVVKVNAKVDMGGAKVDMDMEVYYVRKGNEVVILPFFKSVPDLLKDELPENMVLTEKEFDEQLKALKADEATWDELWKSEEVMKVNAFSVGSGEEKLTCTGAVVYAVIMSVVDVALLAFATLSVVFFVLDKKQGKKTEQAA